MLSYFGKEFSPLFRPGSTYPSSTPAQKAYFKSLNHFILRKLTQTRQMKIGEQGLSQKNEKSTATVKEFQDSG